MKRKIIPACTPAAILAALLCLPGAAQAVACYGYINADGTVRMSEQDIPDRWSTCRVHSADRQGPGVYRVWIENGEISDRIWTRSTYCSGTVSHPDTRSSSLTFWPDTLPNPHSSGEYTVWVVRTFDHAGAPADRDFFLVCAASDPPR